MIFVIAAVVILFFIFWPRTGDQSTQEGTEANVEVSKNANSEDSPVANSSATDSSTPEDGDIVVDGAGQEETVPAVTTPTVELTGSFVNGAHTTKGAARIEEKNGQKILIFADDFTTEDGPDLHVYLSGAQNPQSSADIHAQGDVDLGALQNITGAQEYVIPADLDFDPASVVVYCVPFKVVFGFANLNK